MMKRYRNEKTVQPVAVKLFLLIALFAGYISVPVSIAEMTGGEITTGAVGTGVVIDTVGTGVVINTVGTGVVIGTCEEAFASERP